MRKRDRHPPDLPPEEVEAPAAEAQGDGQPEPADVQSSDGNEPAGTESSGTGAAPSDLSRQLDEQREKYLRLAAEYDNYRRRTSKERAEAASRGQSELVGRLLEALDDLGRFAHVEPGSTDFATLHKGVELVEQKLLKVLTAAGLEIIEPVDQSFDPNLHEAITTEPALSREDDNTVGRVYQRGYRFGGQLLRPARVVVKQFNQR
jgi:molecular chaperone GrpE